MPPQTPKEIIILLVIWGDAFWEKFLTKNLSTRLGKDNLKALSLAFKVTYKIYTTQKDIDTYSLSSEIMTLKKCVNTQLIPLDINTMHNKYSVFSTIHKQALLEADGNQAFIFDFPDHLYSADFFAKLIPIIKRGKRVILAPGLRLSLQDVYTDPIFTSKILNQTEYSLSDFLTMGIRNLHPHCTLGRFKENTHVPEALPILLWKLDPNSFLLQGFHFHPLFFWPKHNIPLLCQTIDYGEYLYNSCPDKKDRHTCFEENIYYFELTDKNATDEQRLSAKPHILNYLYWAKQFAHPYQIKDFSRKKIYSTAKKSIPFKVYIKWLLFNYSFKLLIKLPMWILKPFFFSIYKIDKVKPQLKFKEYLQTEFIGNYYETFLSNAIHQNFDIKEILDCLKDNLNKISPTGVIYLLKSLDMHSKLNKELSDYLFFLVMQICNPSILKKAILKSIKFKNKATQEFLNQVLYYDLSK